MPFTKAQFAQLAALGVEELRIEYYGHGDEGIIDSENIYPTPEVDLPDALAEELASCAEDLLEREHPGWEINEGSEGHITLDLQRSSVTLEHANIEPVYDDPKTFPVEG